MKKKYKEYNKNIIHTSDFEKLSIDYIISLYKETKDNDLRNEIILYFMNKYNKYFKMKIKTFINNDDKETFLYILIKDLLEKYIEFNKKWMSFKSYVLMNQDYKIKFLSYKNKKNIENIEKWKWISISNFSDFDINEEWFNIEEIISDKDNEIEMQNNILLNDIDKYIKTLWKRGEIFYNRTFNHVWLKELWKEYWISIERVRQIEDDIRKNIKKIYWNNYF